MKTKKTYKIQLAFLATILTLSLLASNILIVNAEVGGTGKYLEIDFGDAAEVSNCYVNATKSSGQIFTFLANDTATFSQKVGAGDVILEAFPDTINGWEFVHFLIDGEERDNSCTYKTEKYDVVSAVFEINSYVDFQVSIANGLGDIKYDLNGDGVREVVAYLHSDSELNDVIVPVPYDSSPIFEFVPIDGNHLSAILIDESSYVDLVLSEFTQSYQFFNVKTGHSLSATFSLDGEAIIPGGSNVAVFLSSAASLTFDNIPLGGVATGNQYPTGDVLLWDISVVGTFEDQVIVSLVYNEGDIPVGVTEEELRLWISDPDTEQYWKCDLDENGIIDGQDVKIISNIIKHPKFLDGLTSEEIARYNIDCDPNNVIDENDIHAVNSNIGMTVEWIDITFYDRPEGFIDTENNIIYGITGHFSLFRCR